MANFVPREDGYLLYANSQDNRGIVQKWMDTCTNYKGKIMNIRIHPLEKNYYYIRYKDNDGNEVLVKELKKPLDDYLENYHMYGINRDLIITLRDIKTDAEVYRFIIPSSDMYFSWGKRHIRIRDDKVKEEIKKLPNKKDLYFIAYDSICHRYVESSQRNKANIPLEED